MDKLRFATVWLGGCSGCHMSFLDLDEWLIDLSERVELVFSPLMDVKDYPDGVDVVLVEGAVANDENLEMARRLRARSRYLISFGDCAVTGNVTALRNPLGLALEVLRPVYLENGDLNARLPGVVSASARPEDGSTLRDREVVPVLLDKVLPVHQVVPVDFYLPGCPPPAARIRAVLQSLLEGKAPVLDAFERNFG